MKEMMQLVVDKAELTGRCTYLFRNSKDFDYSFRYMPGWFFKAFPGGRKQLSVEGQAWLKKEEEGWISL
jgi:hypothetical protein